MRCRTVVLFIFLCLFSIILHSQSATPWPKTLLWRISGNGLSKNSFLYGTMHLQDKRLFQFGDSVYRYMESADGYAMEVNFQELVDSLLQKAISEAADDIYDNDEDEKSEKQLLDSLVKEIKTGKNKSARKLLKTLRTKKLNKLTRKEMPTIVDCYLYGIAQKQAKWLGSVEDVQDQLSILDEFGNDVSSDELMLSDAQARKLLDQMIQMYVSQDIGAIEYFSTKQYSNKAEDKLFLQRNRKMALRMDSLANIRSMFFAVGAAHLPGDSGVINLLRKKGYSVDPVFSSETRDPVEYVSRLSDVPWVKVEDENKTYEIEMPGKASEFTMFDYIKMNVHVDITTLTYFMSGSIISQHEIDPSRIMEQMKQKNTKIEDRKKIDHNGMKGMEGMMFSNGYYYKVQYLVKGKTLYMLMVGSDKKAAINSPDSKKFFSSFVPNEATTVKEQKEWKLFTMQDKAFQVMLPDMPKRNRSIESKADGTNWKFFVYDLNHVPSSSYYLVQVRDILPGYYLSGDSAYFSLFKESISSVVDSVFKEEITTVSGFPAYRFDAKSTEQNFLYKVFALNRGNRVYTLIAVASDNDENKANLDRFEKSFTLINYTEVTGKRELEPGKNFYSIVPSPFEEKISPQEDEEESPAEKKDDKHYISYNADEAISYEVFKTVISPYYWISGDSLFFERMGSQYKSYEDSVLNKQAVQNGKLKGMEWTIQIPGSNNLKRIRHLLNGDTLYTLMRFIPVQYFNEDRHNRFFSSFRLTYEDTNFSIFKSKAGKLLSDLRSKDSVIFTKALDALSIAEFSLQEKSLLEQSLLFDYLDDSSYYLSARDRLVNSLNDMTDSGTVDFVRLHFNDNEKAKFNLLDLLARYKTAYSYSVLKELLLKHTPKEKGALELSYRIIDSIELAKKLFPEILELSNNTLFAERLISITKELLDSNAISIEMLLPFKENFLYTADTILNTLSRTSKEEFWGGNYTDLVNLLGKFNDGDCNAMLQRYLVLEDLYIKNETVINLLKNNQQVKEKDIQLLAEDNDYRRSLYEQMKKMGKAKLFPSKYTTQKYMAESDMYVSAYDDDGESYEVKLISERETLYKGEKKRFYLFKVIYKYETGDEDNGESDVYLGIAGPYSLDSKNLDTDKDATGLFYKANFDSKKINEQFEEWLQMMQEPPPSEM